jgi:hypothetical protein
MPLVIKNAADAERSRQIVEEVRQVLNLHAVRVPGSQTLDGFIRSQSTAVEARNGTLDFDDHPVLLGKRIEINEAQAEVIRRIFEWVAQGTGLSTIVKRLNAEGIPGTRGKRWSKGAVETVVHNERYLARRVQRGPRVSVNRPDERSGAAYTDEPTLSDARPHRAWCVDKRAKRMAEESAAQILEPQPEADAPAVPGVRQSTHSPRMFRRRLQQGRVIDSSKRPDAW